MPFLTHSELAILGLSLKVASACAISLTIPGILLGWLLARRRFRGRALVDALIHAPLVMPPVVIGYLLLILLGRRGLIGGWLFRNFGVSLAFTWQAAAIASSIVALPLMVRSVRLAIELTDTRLEQAARNLGSSPRKSFFTITLPLAYPGIFTGLVLAFARSLGEFGATIVFAGNIEGETRTLPLAIYSALQIPGGEDTAFRLALASVFLAVAALAFSEWLSHRSRRYMESVQ